MAYRLLASKADFYRTLNRKSKHPNGSPRMMLLATEIDATQAVSCGLADHGAADGSTALAEALVLAQQLARGPQRAYGRIKNGLRQSPM